MIDEATDNDTKQFVIADLLDRRLKSTASAESAGLVTAISTQATSTGESLSAWLVLAQRGTPRIGAEVSRHPADLKSYAGQWVVISGGEVAEHGPDLADVVNRARQRGESTPYVLFVEELREGAALLSL